MARSPPWRQSPDGSREAAPKPSAEAIRYHGCKLGRRRSPSLVPPPRARGRAFISPPMHALRARRDATVIGIAWPSLCTTKRHTSLLPHPARSGSDGHLVQGVPLGYAQERGRGTLIEHLGIELLEAGEDYLSARMPVNANTRQPAGMLRRVASLSNRSNAGRWSRPLAPLMPCRGTRPRSATRHARRPGGGPGAASRGPDAIAGADPGVDRRHASLSPSHAAVAAFGPVTSFLVMPEHQESAAAPRSRPPPCPRSP